MVLYQNIWSIVFNKSKAFNINDDAIFTIIDLILIYKNGFDNVICFDDFPKHSKSYRQISLIWAKIPSRDAFPSDIEKPINQ